MKTLLIFPPYFSPTHPYLSLPCLTAYLKSKGLDAVQLDLNIECYNYFLSPAFLSRCEKKLNHKNAGDETAKRRLLCDYLIENVEAGKKIFKDPNLFYDLKNYKFAKTCVLQAIKLISDIYEMKSIGSVLTFDEKYDLKQLLNLLQDTGRNPFADFYSHYFTKKDTLEAYDVYGISLINDDQIVPTLLLCKYIKAVNPKAHITIGGNIFSKIAYKIEIVQELFNRFFDSIILFEGEDPLYQLITTLASHGELSDVPNLIYKDRRTHEIQRTGIKSSTDVNLLPAPCFDGIDFSKYFSPIRMIPYYFSRSCYWGKCAFCDHDFGYDGKYRIKNLEKIMTDLKYLKDTYQVTFFDFVDEAIPPKVLEGFCDQLEEKEMRNIRWFNCIKADSNFTDDICKKMKDSGCQAIYIGVESCSEKLLLEMDKGINLEKIHTTLSNMNKNHIWNHVFLINNFPTETKEDKYNTLTYVMKNKHLFHSIGLSEFTLGAKSKIMTDLGRYQIQEVSEAGELKSFLEFKLAKDFSIKEREANTKELKDIYNLIETNAFAANTIKYREHMPIFLSKYDLGENRNMYRSTAVTHVHEDTVLNDSIICREFNINQAVLYHLDHDFMYVLPSYFIKIIDFFKEKRKQEEIDIFFQQQISQKNREKIISFLNQTAILSQKVMV